MPSKLGTQSLRVPRVRQARLGSCDPAQHARRDVDHADPPASAFPQRLRRRDIAARAGQPAVETQASSRPAAAVRRAWVPVNGLT